MLSWFGWSCKMNRHLTPNLQTGDGSRIWIRILHDSSDHDIWVTRSRMKKSIPEKEIRLEQCWLFLLQFWIELVELFLNLLDLFCDVLNILRFIRILTLSCSFWSLWAVTLSIFSMFSDKIPLNMTSFSMTCFEAAAADKRGWTRDRLWLRDTQSDHSRNDGFTPSNDVGWGTWGTLWSWANILMSAPSWRWKSHLNFRCSPNDDVTVVFVIDLIFSLIFCTLVLTSSATMSKDDEMLTECEHDQNQKSPETRWPDLIMDLDLDLWSLHAFEHETHDNDG